MSSAYRLSRNPGKYGNLCDKDIRSLFDLENSNLQVEHQTDHFKSNQAHKIELQLENLLTKIATYT